MVTIDKNLLYDLTVEYNKHNLKTFHFLLNINKDEIKHKNLLINQIKESNPIYEIKFKYENNIGGIWYDGIFHVMKIKERVFTILNNENNLWYFKDWPKIEMRYSKYWAFDYMYDYYHDDYLASDIGGNGSFIDLKDGEIKCKSINKLQEIFNQCLLIKNSN